MIDTHAEPHVIAVLGPVAPEQLGVCLHHEHILCDTVAVTEDEPDYRLDDIDRACEQVDAFITAGGSGIVDASPRDYGRDIRGLHRIAQRVPVHIIAVTGRHKHLHAERMDNALDAESLTAEYVDELVHGIGQFAIRPGIIKFGTSLDEMTAARAAARTHLMTGTAITTHLEAGTHAHRQLDVLEEEGVDPSRVILGHLDRSLNRAYLTSVLDRGAFGSFDQVGKDAYGADSPKITMLLDHVDAGYENQLLVSQDFARKSNLASYGGTSGLAHLLERFTLELMEHGAPAALVMKLLVENPSRALTTVPR